MALPAQHTSPQPARSTWYLPQLHQWLVVPSIVALVTATLGRLLVFSPGIGAREIEVLRWLDGTRNGVLDVLTLVLHHAFSTPGALVLIGALTAWLVRVRHRAWDAAGFAITALSGWAAVAVVKAAVGRARPGVPTTAEPLVQLEGFTSFPSGHTGVAVAVAAALFLVLRRSRRAPLVLAAGGGIAVLVGLSRLYLGVHHPLDVLASFPVAWAGVVVGCGLANILVPAFAYGFGWQQEGAGWPEDEGLPVEAPAPDQDAHPVTARVPVVAHPVTARVPVVAHQVERRAA